MSVPQTLPFDEAFVLARLADKAGREPGQADRYVLEPKLSAREVQGLEAQHGFEFPADYRLFLTTIGGGGAGPHHGLWSAQSAAAAGVGQRFVPLSDEDDGGGYLLLSEYGCGNLSVLVVAGEERGHVFDFLDGLWVPWLPDEEFRAALASWGNSPALLDELNQHHALVQKRSFGEWYLDWLRC
ncbi:SMI1/KNR4 family protein [Deinococcus sp. SDU3-2]|uniref:SMI1/KNR4 family protein n=1 Tax=Deinococcus terrestris TaxID=2651870 RepID=A0A7X1NWK7_9DEIO|nr:SMI1/KNR4 family protein [Deinococcus terrestris]MPY67156.1 SMI1/KNR4 family protein [Deinococcus terrestris]